MLGLRTATWSLLAILAACVPSYAVAPDASPDGAAPMDAAPTEAGGDASHPTDAGITDSAPADTGQTADVGVDAPSGPGVVSLDPGFPKLAKIVGGRDAGADAVSTTLSTTFDVPAGGRMLVAVVIWGQYGGSDVWPVLFSGGGYTWTSSAQTASVAAYYHAVGVGVWTAWAPAAASGVTVTATRSNSANADAMLAVYSLAGASQSVGSTGTTNGFGADGGAPMAMTLPLVEPGSFVTFGLLDGNGAGVYGVRGTPFAGTSYDQYVMSPSGNGLALGRMAAGFADGGAVTLGTDYPPVQTNVGAAVEIRPQ